MVEERRPLVVVHRYGWLQLARFREVVQSGFQLPHLYQTQASEECVEDD